MLKLDWWLDFLHFSLSSSSWERRVHGGTEEQKVRVFIHSFFLFFSTDFTGCLLFMLVIVSFVSLIV